jgi:hypothetical protein
MDYINYDISDVSDIYDIIALFDIEIYLLVLLRGIDDKRTRKKMSPRGKRCGI